MIIPVLLYSFAGLTILCAVIPAALFVINLRSYLAPPPSRVDIAPLSISVLIPARNEQANIATALGCVLASNSLTLEVLVLDDASSDATPQIVSGIAALDQRVKLMRSATLPAGWNGKQHACWQLAKHSTAPLMLFLDADVRFEPDAIARMAAFHQASGASLVSGFPRLITVGFLEWLLLPLIHFVLLGFLPVERMRKTTDPAMAAGCGQFMLVEREAYFASGGHESIRATMHDGLLLPRAFRRAGFHTDLADLTPLACVRMYDTAAKVWQGLAKNATEGIAAPNRIVPLTILLLLGQVMPGLLVLNSLAGLALSSHAFRTSPAFFWGAIAWLVTCVFALIASYLPRLLAARRFKQPLKSALLHPLGIMLLLCIQWYALTRQLLGRPVGWRQRAYTPTTGAEL
jgi:glycosyltransferase involved in cell wall biosynthesis